MTTFTFNATWIGDEGIESEVISAEAVCLADAMAAVALEVNGVNSFGDCLIGLDLLN